MASHHISGSGTLNGLDVGKAWLLPPTLTLQYHFTDFGPLKPYIGAGINYTAFFNQSAANTPLAGLAVADVRISNQFGAAVQFGFDYMLDRHWGLNFDVKKLWLRPDYSATVNNAIAVIWPRQYRPMARQRRNHVQVMTIAQAPGKRSACSDASATASLRCTVSPAPDCTRNNARSVSYELMA
ncbi:hypothetical protein ACVIGA_005620 [Bradyrhizobium sp. USDA 3240]